MQTIIEKVMILKGVDFFSRCTTRELSQIATISEEVAFRSGEVIFREGDPNNALFVVLAGSVRLQKDEEEVGTIGANEAFGVWSLFDEEPRLVSAVSAEDARLLRLDREDFFDLLSEQFDITQKIFQAIVGRLKSLVQ
jgi:CRP-like cAMP-binding protein